MESLSSQSLTVQQSTRSDTLPSLATLAVTVPVADVRREPANDAELVTQALLNASAVVLGEAPGWVHVQLADYEGWIASRHLGQPARTGDEIAVVLLPKATVFAGPMGPAASGHAYATTVLPALSADVFDRVQVALPGGSAGWMDRSDVAIRSAAAPFPSGDPDVALALARQFLDTPYLWGGTTSAGIDCSGFAQLCCRAAGHIIRRDADQQYESIPYLVGIGDLRAGDLIFFAYDGAITHVAMMLDAARYIHAKGSPDSRVRLNSLTPGDADYHESLAQHFAGARRPFA